MTTEIQEAENELDYTKQKAVIAKMQVESMYKREEELRQKLLHASEEVKKAQAKFCNAMTETTAAVEKLKKAYVVHAEKLGSV